MARTSIQIQLALTGLNAVRTGLLQIGQTARSTFTSIRPHLATLGAGLSVVTGGLVALTKEAINNADELSKMSQKVGIATEDLSGLAYAANLSDVKTESLGKGLKSLATYMRQAGINGRDLMDVLLEQADIFAALPDGPEKTALAIERFGRAGMDMIPLLNGGARGIREMREEADRLGITVSTEFGKAAEEFNDNLTRLKTAAKGYAQSLATELLPSLNNVLISIRAYLSSVSGSQMSNLMSGVGEMADSAVQTGLGLMKMGQTFTGDFIGGMIGGESFTEALKNSAASAVAATDEYFDTVIEMKKKKAEEAKSIDPGFVPAQDDILRSLQNSMVGFRIMQDTWRNGRGQGVESTRQQAELVRLQLRDLEKIMQIEQARLTEAQAKFGFAGADGRTRKTEEGLKLEQQYNAYLQKRLELERELRDLEDDTSFFSRMQANLVTLSDQWSQLGRNIADGLTGAITSGVQTIAAGLTDVIMRTKSWGEALRNIGTTILSTVIQTIIQMGVQWVVTHLIMKGVAVAFHSLLSALGWARVAESNAQEAAKAPALATNAALAGAGSWGLSAVVGLALVGALVAAFAGAFAEGGMTPGRPSWAIVGEQGPEFVVPARATAALGRENLEMIRKGQLPAVPVSSGESTGGKPQRIVIVDDTRAVADLENDPAFENIVVRIGQRNRFRTG